MNRKKIIQIVVIIFAFGGSGIVLYNGLFKNSPSPAPVTSSPGTMATAAPGAGSPLGIPGAANGAGGAIKNIDQILPNGEALNLDVVNRPNVVYDTLSLPQVNPKLEVGIDENLLIIPPPKPSNNNGGLLKSP